MHQLEIQARYRKQLLCLNDRPNTTFEHTHYCGHALSQRQTDIWAAISAISKRQSDDPIFILPISAGTRQFSCGSRILAPSLRKVTTFHSALWRRTKMIQDFRYHELTVTDQFYISWIPPPYATIYATTALWDVVPVTHRAWRQCNMLSVILVARIPTDISILLTRRTSRRSSM